MPAKETKLDAGVLKQRLVGIVVLLALAVIIIPMVLDFRKDYDQVIMGTNIPPKPDDFRVEVLPLDPRDTIKQEPSPPVVEMQPQAEMPDEQPVSEQSAGPADTPVSTEDRLPDKPVETPDKPAETDVLEADHQQTEVPVSKAAPEAVVWVVQVGSFSNEQNAVALHQRLNEQGYNALIEKVMAGDKQVFRLRVGSEKSRSRAETLRAMLAEEMQIQGMVVVSGQ